jgi:hypothetical protein
MKIFTEAPEEILTSIRLKMSPSMELYSSLEPVDERNVAVLFFFQRIIPTFATRFVRFV